MKLWRKNQQEVIIGHVRVPIDSVPIIGEDRGYRVIFRLTRVQRTGQGGDTWRSGEEIDTDDISTFM